MASNSQEGGVGQLDTDGSQTSATAMVQQIIQEHQLQEQQQLQQQQMRRQQMQQQQQHQVQQVAEPQRGTAQQKPNLQRQQQQALAQQQLQRLAALKQQQQLQMQQVPEESQGGPQVLTKGIALTAQQQQQLLMNQQQQQGNRQLVVGQKSPQYVVMVGGKPGQVQQQQQQIQARPAAPADVAMGQKRLASQQLQQQELRLQRKKQTGQQQRVGNKVQGGHNMVQQQPQVAQQITAATQQSPATLYTLNNANMQTNQNVVQYRVVQSQHQLAPQQCVQQVTQAQQYIQQTAATPTVPKKQRKLTGDTKRQDVVKITMPASTNLNKMVQQAIAKSSTPAGKTHPGKVGSQTHVTYVSSGPQPSAMAHPSPQQQQTAVSAAKQQLQQLNQRMVAPQPRLRAPTSAYTPRAPAPTTMANQPSPSQASGAINGGLPNAPAPSPTPSPGQSIPPSQMGNLSTNNLVIGEEYVIQYSNGRKVVGTWDGKYFKIKPSGSTANQGSAQAQPAAGATSNASSSHVAGGGSAANQPPQSGENGQQWSNDGMARPPNNPQAQATDQQPQTPARPPRPTEDGKYAVCSNCGAHSANYDVCESCQRPLPDDVKFYSPGNNPAPKRQRLLDTPQQVAQQVLLMQQGKGKAGTPLNTYGDPVRKAGKSLSASSKKTPVKRSRGRGRPLHSIETVTILSSEDEEDSNSRHSDMSAPSPAPPSNTASTATTTAPSPVPTSQATPSTAAMAIRQQQQLAALRQQQAQQQQAKQSAANVNIPPGMPGAAAVRNGLLPINALSHLPPQSPAPTTPLQPGTTVLVKTRSIRIGTLKTSSADPVSFNLQGISFVLALPDTSRLQVLLPAKELTGVLGHFGRAMPLLFVHVSASCAYKLRHVFNMKAGTEPYFDPDAKKSCHKRITLILSAMTDQVHQTIVSICHHIQKENPDLHGDGRLLTELDYTLGNYILINSSTPTATGGAVMMGEGDGDGAGDEEEPMDRSRSPSPPRVFNGEIVKLFTYPPAPATGGITVTNEDLFCLNEGEFLNDVIIDFYLKYLFIDSFTKEDQDRTHVFSSFFYRRLTQKQARRGDEAPNMTPAQRRHTRVRTWTRHVDLFDKDFIIVPINESAHWYLAIICFPGLRVPTIGDAPSDNNGTATPPPTTSADGTKTQSSDEETKTENSTEKNPGEKSKKNGNKKFRAILKQPCILIFDSLAGPSRSSVIRTLREYLQVEWETKKKEKEGARVFDRDTFKGATPKVPQQTNFSDCGVYVLQYVESFFQNPLTDYNIPMKSLSSWFTEEQVIRKREELSQLIMVLQKELNPDLDYDPAQDGCMMCGLQDDEEDDEEMMPDGTVAHVPHHPHLGSSAPHVVTGGQQQPPVQNAQPQQPPTQLPLQQPVTQPMLQPQSVAQQQQISQAQLQMSQAQQRMSQAQQQVSQAQLQMSQAQQQVSQAQQQQPRSQEQPVSQQQQILQAQPMTPQMVQAVPIDQLTSQAQTVAQQQVLQAQPITQQVLQAVPVTQQQQLVMSGQTQPISQAQPVSQQQIVQGHLLSQLSAPQPVLSQSVPMTTVQMTQAVMMLSQAPIQQTVSQPLPTEASHQSPQQAQDPPVEQDNQPAASSQAQSTPPHTTSPPAPPATEGDEGGAGEPMEVEMPQQEQTEQTELMDSTQTDTATEETGTADTKDTNNQEQSQQVETTAS